MARTTVAAVLVVVVAAVCVRLGMWQLSRHAERQARNEQIASRALLPPIDLNESPPTDDLAFRAATASGRFDWRREIVEYARSLGGVPGVVLAAPLLLDSGRAIIVERGWVPSPDARQVDLDSYREPDSAVVRGMLLRTESSRPIVGQEWPMETMVIDPEALADRFPYALLPWVLRRTDSTGGAAGTMVPFPPPDLGAGPHLSYAVQWFLFASVAVIGGVAVFWKTRREATSNRLLKTGDS